MSDFYIDIRRCRGIDADLQSVESTLSRCYSRLNTTLRKLNNCGINYVDNQVKNTRTSIDNQRKKVNRLRTALNTCLDTYSRTESELVSEGGGDARETERETAVFDNLTGYDLSRIEDFLRFIAGLNIIPNSALFLALYDLFMNSRNNGGSYSIDSTLYDESYHDDRIYGGNQGSMVSDFENDYNRRMELLNELREYFPNMTQEEAYAYLDHLNQTGCGYTAMVNTIFMYYENNPEGFLRDFGFPMYRDGEPNYDRLLLDLYTYTDINNLNDGQDGLPVGTTAQDRNNILNEYMGERGVHVRSQYNQNINAERFREITERGGAVVLSLHNDNMIRTDGSEHPINGGHALVVTGISGNILTVSSWGKIYYVDMSVLDFNDSFSVIYYK